MGLKTAEQFPEPQLAISADRIFDGYRWHNEAMIVIDRGAVRCIAPRDDELCDLPLQVMPSGTMLAPGFIDLQVNGGGGVLLNDMPTSDAMHAIARAHLRYGTTSCLPTLITDTREKGMAAIAAAKMLDASSGVLGIHLEGPFINRLRLGIHRADYIRDASNDDLDWLGELSSAGRSLVTLAPECVPSGFIERLVKSGICVSVGHSEATAANLTRAMAEGLRGVTHLFNAMPPMSAREPGIVAMALTDERLTAGIILDGVHVDPLVVRAAFSSKNRRGMALVSDAMPTVGTERDRFELMGRQIRLQNGCLVSAEGTLAGAHLNLASAVKNAVTLVGIPLDDALRAASLVPARLLGIENRGALVAGTRADIVALTKSLDVLSTWIAGRQFEEKEARRPFRRRN
jgi:N-acetylglucosamine-6-phosphate deacetylase